MITTTRIIDEKHTELTLDFSDEGVALVGVTEVLGDASSYAHFFESDLRRNNAELFPAPEPKTPEMGGEMI